jgi:hypothetical protein
MILISLITERISWGPASRINEHIRQLRFALVLRTMRTDWMKMMSFVPIKARIQGERSSFRLLRILIDVHVANLNNAPEEYNKRFADVIGV